MHYQTYSTTFRYWKNTIGAEPIIIGIAVPVDATRTEKTPVSADLYCSSYTHLHSPLESSLNSSRQTHSLPFRTLFCAKSQRVQYVLIASHLWHLKLQSSHLRESVLKYYPPLQFMGFITTSWLNFLLKQSLLPISSNPSLQAQKLFNGFKTLPDHFTWSGSMGSS